MSKVIDLGYTLIFHLTNNKCECGSSLLWMNEKNKCSLCSNCGISKINEEILTKIGQDIIDKMLEKEKEQMMEDYATTTDGKIKAEIMAKILGNNDK